MIRIHLPADSCLFLDLYFIVDRTGDGFDLAGGTLDGFRLVPCFTRYEAGQAYLAGCQINGGTRSLDQMAIEEIESFMATTRETPTLLLIDPPAGPYGTRDPSTDRQNGPGRTVP